METQAIPSAHPTVVPLADIDLADRCLQVSSDEDAADLAASIAAVGLLNPPRLVRPPAGERWRVVSGFRRLAACAQLGWSEVPAWCLAPETTASSCALMAIADNALQRPLDLIEQVRASRLLLDNEADLADLRASARAVGLAPNIDLLRQLRSLSEAPPSLLTAMAAGAIQLPMALALAQRPPRETEALADLFQRLRPSLNRQRECLTLLEEIARRDDLPVREVLVDAVATTQAADTPPEGAARFQRLREALRRRRYPHLVAAEAARETQLRRLKLDPQMRLMPPANFEGRSFQLQLTFTSPDQLKAQASACQRLCDDPALAALFD